MIAPPKPPAHDGSEALIKEARERRRRRHLLTAAGVAVAAAVALSVHALAGGPGNRNAADGSESNGPPLCRASQLSTEFGTGGAAGTALGNLMITSTARSFCSLPPGRPAVQIIFRGKPLRTVQDSYGHQGFGPLAAHVLRPGERVFYEIGWSSACPNPAAAPKSPRATARFQFSDGFRLVVPDTPDDRNGVSLPGCGEALHPTPSISVSPLLRYR
jgi:Protein of unknown function (DUF4232)